MVAALVGASSAWAGRMVIMPVDFVGEWCFDSQEKNTTSYTSPSWTEDGHCTKILVITQYDFYGNAGIDDKEAGWGCMPAGVRIRNDTAPSGTAHYAMITAICEPDGTPTTGKLQSFEFYRYKGNLSITIKSAVQ
jgi:hypothetical protein